MARKQRYMQNLRPMFVSLVSKAANRREFLTRKDEDGHDVETVQVPILKSEDVDGVRYVTGVAYEPGVVDTQGDQMTAAEIEKAAHLYLRDYRGIDVQHSNKPEDGCWVAESAILKADTEIGGETVPAGAWVLTMGIENPDVVAKIDKGELNGFSIGGFAQYVVKSDFDDAVEQTPTWFSKFLAMIGFSPKTPEPEPPQVQEPKSEPEPKEDAPKEKTPDKKPEDKEKGEKTVKKSEFAEIVNGLGEALIAKGVVVEDAGQPAEPRPVEKTAETGTDIAAVIKQAVVDGFAEVAKAQAEAAKPAEAPAPQPEPKQVEKSDAPEQITTDTLMQIVKSAVSEQVAPMQEQMNAIAKSYNIGPKNLNGTSQPVEKSAESHYMDGVFSA